MNLTTGSIYINTVLENSISISFSLQTSSDIPTVYWGTSNSSLTNNSGSLSAGTTSYQINSLNPNIQYFIQIEDYDPSNAVTYYSPIVDTFTLPQSLTGAGQTSYEITGLSETSTYSINVKEGNAVGYSVSTLPIYFSLQPLAGAGQTSYEITGLSDGTLYSVTVEEGNSIGYSVPTFPVYSIALSGSGGTAAGNNFIISNLQPNMYCITVSEAASDLSKVSVSSFPTIAFANSTSPPIYVNGTQVDINANGVSSVSVSEVTQGIGCTDLVSSPTTLGFVDPEPPTCITVSSSNNNNIINWNDGVVTGNASLSGYNILRSSNYINNYTKIGFSASNTFADTAPLVPNYTNFYSVETVDNIGNTSNKSISAFPAAVGIPNNFFYIKKFVENLLKIGLSLTSFKVVFSCNLSNANGAADFILDLDSEVENKYSTIFEKDLIPISVKFLISFENITIFNGMITDFEGNPLQYITLNVYTVDNYLQQSYQTDINGKFSIYGLEKKYYWLEFLIQNPSQIVLLQVL